MKTSYMKQNHIHNTIKHLLTMGYILWNEIYIYIQNWSVFYFQSMQSIFEPIV